MKTERRSGWALLAVSALVASLLAVGVAPAGAAEIKAGEDNKAEPNAEATFSACVGDARDAHGFTDLGSLEATVPNINCLAYYGITVGRTADTFEPDENVTRREMALFLYRAAGKAGVDLMGGDGDADFGDIAELGENWQNAITALARKDILSGSGGNFRPKDDITRAEMAVALVNLVRHTAPGNFVQAGTDKGKLAVNGAAISSDDLDWFADARASVPVRVDTAISYAYELGIAEGVGDGTMFDPSGTVPRRDMATFIMRTLAHSNLRPEGLTVQSDDGALTASIRNADFEPLVNELVDAFYVAATSEDRAFNNDGECRSIVKAVDGSDSSTCEISVLDAATDAEGNAPLNGLTATQIGEGVTVWVWTGDSGDEVDEDSKLVKFDQGPATPPNEAEKITVSPSQAKTSMARFGTAVEFTAQLQYEDGGLDKDTSVGADRDLGRAEYGLVKHVYMGVVYHDPASTDDQNFHVDESTGEVTAYTDASTDAASRELGLVSTSAEERIKTDAEGKITFELSTDDPNPLPTSLLDTRTVVYVLTPLKNAPGAATTSGGNPETRAFGYVVFGEAAPEVTTVKAESIGSYARPPVSAARPTSHGVTVTVLDQYGRPMRNQPVTLTSNLNMDANTDGDFDDDDDTHYSRMPSARRTGPNGIVRVFYRHSGLTAQVETITAWWESTRNLASTHEEYPSAVVRPANCPETGQGSYRGGESTDNGATTADVTSFRCGTTSVYWAVTATNVDSDVDNDDTDDALSILAGSVDDGEVVVDSDTNADDRVVTPWLVRYDDNDIFYATVPDRSGGTTSSYLDSEAFEELLATILAPANQALDSDAPGKRSGKLAWDGYDHDDEDQRTLFTFELTVVAATSS